MGRRRSYMTRFEGIVTSLERRYSETDSSQQRERIEEYMSFRPCPECKGARLKPEVLAVTVGDKAIHEFTRMSVTRSLEFLGGLRLTETEQLIGARIIKEIRERLTSWTTSDSATCSSTARPRRSRAGRRSASGSRPRSARSWSASSTSSTSRRIGLHQRDNDKLIDDARAAARPGQHRPGRRARRADDARRRLASSTWARARASTAGTSSPRARPQDIERNPKLDHGPVPLRQAARSRSRERRTEDLGSFYVRGRGMHNLKEIDVAFPVGKLRPRHGCLGLGQVHARNEIVYKALANRLHRHAREAGRSRSRATGSSASTR